MKKGFRIYRRINPKQIKKVPKIGPNQTNKLQIVKSKHKNIYSKLKQTKIRFCLKHTTYLFSTGI